MPLISFDNRKALVVAHAGLAGLYPANSSAGFTGAGQGDFWGIETDVHLTADGEFVCIHDDTTGRTADRDLPVESSTRCALRRLRLKWADGRVDPDLRIPTVGEYLRTCRAYGKRCVLELKNPIPREHILALLAQVDALGCRELMVYISFCMENLDVIRAEQPDTPCQFLTERWDDGLIDRLRAHRTDLDIHYSALDRQRVAALLDAGITVNCWTVDDAKTAEALAEYGVHQITTNILTPLHV